MQSVQDVRNVCLFVKVWTVWNILRRRIDIKKTLISFLRPCENFIRHFIEGQNVGIVSLSTVISHIFKQIAWCAYSVLFMEYVRQDVDDILEYV